MKSERKENPLKTFVDERELKLIKQAAKRKSLPVSAWLRVAAIETARREMKDQEE